MAKNWRKLGENCQNSISGHFGSVRVGSGQFFKSLNRVTRTEMRALIRTPRSLSLRFYSNGRSELQPLAGKSAIQKVLTQIFRKSCTCKTQKRGCGGGGHTFMTLSELTGFFLPPSCSITHTLALCGKVHPLASKYDLWFTICILQGAPDSGLVLQMYPTNLSTDTRFVNREGLRECDFVKSWPG